DEEKFIKGRWSPQEDQALQHGVSRLMVRCPWGLIVKSIDGRSGIQAQARWSEALDPQVRRGKWSLREDRLLFEGVEKHARCWIRIADGIPGRTQRQCRTRW
ncbi:MAG: Homeodomain-like protein, partial [Podila humilis]